MLIARSLCTAAKGWLDDAALWDLNWERCMACTRETRDGRKCVGVHGASRNHKLQAFTGTG